MMVGELDGDAGPAAHRDADVGLHQRRRVVDPVADRDNLRAAGLQLADDVGLAVGQHPGVHVVDPSRLATSRAAEALSPVTITAVSPSSRIAASASTASGRTSSPSAITPSGWPSCYTAVTVRPACSSSTMVGCRAVRVYPGWSTCPAPAASTTSSSSRQLRGAASPRAPRMRDGYTSR